MYCKKGHVPLFVFSLNLLVASDLIVKGDTYVFLSAEKSSIECQVTTNILQLVHQTCHPVCSAVIMGLNGRLACETKNVFTIRRHDGSLCLKGSLGVDLHGACHLTALGFANMPRLYECNCLVWCEWSVLCCCRYYGTEECFLFSDSTKMPQTCHDFMNAFAQFVGL